MIPIFDELRTILHGNRFPANNEAQFQAQLSKAFTIAGLSFEREKRLSAGERLDFYLPGSKTAVEVKMGGSAGTVLRQLKRYADLPEVAAVALITRRPLSLPETLSGKPLACLSIWRSLIA